MNVKYFAIFFALFFTDIVWALYIKWAAKGRAGKAALASFFIYMVGAVTIGEFIKDPWVLIPAGLGCFLGTYITIIVAHEKENPNPLFGSRIREALKTFYRG